jgi:uncharacterized SAM-binding protein YcdF (DUF218 family)
LSGKTKGNKRPSKRDYISLRRLARNTTICFLLLLMFFILWAGSDRGKGFREKVKHHLKEELISTDLIQSESKIDAIYILGGTQKSLKRKFEKAAEIYNERLRVEVLFLHVDGITGYSRDMQRNLTNDEWAILNLRDLGILLQDIECITMNEGFFGSFSEAEAVSKLSRTRQYEGIILITSPYHTRRVKLTFRSLFSNHETKCYVQASDEGVYLKDLLLEFMKLKIYKNFLIS